MLPDINLLPKRERQSSFYFYLLIGMFVMCLLVMAYVTYAYFQTKEQLEQTSQMETTLAEKEAALQAKKIKLDTSDEDTLEEAVRRVEEQAIPTSVLINSLLAMLPEHGFLREYTYNLGAVEIHTHFETMSEISTYTERLLESPFVTNVKTKQINTFRVKDTGETGRATSEAIDEYYEKIPRYDTVFELQMNRDSVRNLKEEQADAILKEVLDGFEKGVSADE